MKITKIAELPIREDITIRIRIIEADKNYMTFMFRTTEKEFEFTVEKPKNKYWKNVDLIPGSKINVKVSKTGKSNNKQLIRVG